MANATADNVPTELLILELGPSHNGSLPGNLKGTSNVPACVKGQKTYRSDGMTPGTRYFPRRIGQSASTTVVFRSWHMRVTYSQCRRQGVSDHCEN